MNKAKKYLSEINKLKRASEVLEERIEVLSLKVSSLRGIAYDKDRVEGGKVSGIDDTIIALTEAQKEYQEIVTRYHEAVRIRTEQITAMDNPAYSQILLLRYVEERPMPLYEIAEELHYTHQYVKEMHGKALEEFRRRYL